MVSALSTGNEIGLALMGAAFIVFALVSSFVLPRSNPNFPGRARNWYLLLAVAFFVAMMSAVLVFGREKKAGAETSTPTTTAQAPAAGDPAAGKALFAKSGCGACHTFAAAGSNGKVGPDLDQLKDSAAKANQPLDQFISTSITDPNAYVAPGFPKGVMPTFKLSNTQVQDLVAFLSGS
jgi:mono/diheme cytochrome c family protein